MTHSGGAGDSSPQLLNCLQPPYPTDLFAIRILDAASLEVKIHGELPDQADILIGSHPSAALSLTSAIHPERCVVLRLDRAAHNVGFTYHGGVVRFPSNVSGEWQTLVTPHQRVLKRSTVFYIGKHMFHVAFPDANAAEDNVAVSTLAQSASLPPPSSASLPLAPSSVGSKAVVAQFQPPHVQLVTVQHQQQQQQQAPIVAQPAPRSVVSSLVPLARSSSHVALTAGTESRDGDADESKMSKRRFSAIRRSGTLPQHTPAAHERPLVVPPAPRAHSSHSHSSQKKRDETTSLVAAGDAVAAAVEDVEDEQLDENSEAYDTMDDAKSRDLVAEFSNDTVPKAAFTALADAGQSWDHEDRDIAVSAVPPFTRTSPPSAVPARRASHGAPAHANVAAAVAEAPVEAPVAAASVVAAPVEAPVGAPVEAVAVPSPPEAEVVRETAASKKSAKKRAVPNVSQAARSVPSVVKARKMVAEQTASGRGRRGEGKLSARDMFRQTRQIATEFEVVEKQHAIDENVSAPKRANNKPDVAAKQSKAAEVAQPTKRSHVTFISATPDTNQQRNVPRTPKKSKSTAAAIDPRALISMVQDNDDKNWRETKLLVTNSRMLPTTASRRAGSVLNASMALGRMLAQVHVAPGDDSPSASAQRSGSKSVRRALPLDAVRTK